MGFDSALESNGLQQYTAETRKPKGLSTVKTTNLKAYPQIV